MRCFRRNVTPASLLREGDRVSGGRSFSWHRFIKFYTARVLLQSRPAPAPSRREPFIKSNLSHTEALKICCRQPSSMFVIQKLLLHTPDGVICHFVCKVTQASLLREGDRVSGGRSFSWHRVIKFYTARVLLQSHIRSTAPSRREPLIESNLSPTEAL